MNGEYFQPTVGKIYLNRDGTSYMCLTMGDEEASATFISKGGWKLVAHGCREYSDGKIDWDRSEDKGFQFDRPDMTPEKAAKVREFMCDNSFDMKLYKVDCLCDKSGNKKRFSHCIQAKSEEAAIEQLMDTLEEDGNEPFITCERGDDYVKLLFFNKILYAYYHGFKAEEIVLKRDIEIWVSYEDSHNISEKDYDELWCSNGTYELTDDEAVDLVCGFFGFNKDEVQIIHYVDLYEKGVFTNRLRKIGKTERKPIANDVTGYYVRFDCANYSYEMYNYELYKFYCFLCPKKMDTSSAL